MEKKPQVLAKEAEVAELQKLFNENQAVFLTDYRGISVAEDVELRAKMRAAGVEYRVAKNTLLKIANNNDGSSLFDDYLKGPTAVAFTNQPVETAKIISEFIRNSKKTSIKAGLLDGKLIDAADVEALAKLPSREALLGQVACMMAAPMTAFAGDCAALLRQFATAVDRIREQKEAVA